MIPNLPFFVILTFLGIVLFGFSGLAGRRVHKLPLDSAERVGLRLALEFSLFTVLFALLPFLLYSLLSEERFVWRMGSLLLGVYLFVEMGRICYQANLHKEQWTITMISLLVLSAILLTIELVNVFWWSLFGIYAAGLLWMLTLSAIQYIAFVLYERGSDYQIPRINTAQPPNLPKYEFRGGLPQRLQRDGRADHPYGSADSYADFQRDPVTHARRRRYTNRHSNPAQQRIEGWSVADTLARTNKNSRR